MLIGIKIKYNIPDINIALKVYINKNPKYKTIEKSKKIVIDLGTTIFFKEQVGNLLIKRIETVTKKIGTKTSEPILINSKPLKLYINGIKTKMPPAGEGMPSKKLSLHEGSSLELTLNLASLKATQTTQIKQINQPNLSKYCINFPVMYHTTISNQSCV